MSFRTKRILFITPFYTILQFFLIKYLILLFYPINDITVAAIAILLGLNHFTPMIFESKKSRKITRFLTTIDGVWIWALIFLSIDLLVIYLIGMYINLTIGIKLILLSIIVVLGAYNYYRAHKIVVNEKTIKLDKLTQNINIIQISDVHFGSIRHKQIIQQLTRKLKELESSCDLIIISGDFADGSSVICENDFLEFKKINIPIIFTPGNHDFYPGIENVKSECEKADIIILDDENMEFKDLNIHGLTYSFENRNQKPELDKTCIKSDKINILNYHVPYYWEEFSDLGFDIQLSGHTHGGQFYPAIIFSEIIFKYNKGLFKNNNGKYLHVTTGVGSMDIPMRWGCDSEIVILKLVKSRG